jgi:hypothetical protein
MTTITRSGAAPYAGEKARGGEIILRTPRRRANFIAGLAGALVLALLVGLFAGAANAATPDAGEVDGWATFAMVIVGPLVLAGALLFGIMQWRRRRIGPAMQRERDEAVQRAYRDERG